MEKKLDREKLDKMLFKAVNEGDLEGAKNALELGADANATYHGTTTLLTAAWSNDTGMAGLLVDYGADVNAKDNATWRTHGWTPLHIAVINRNIRLVKLFAEHGADINVQNNEGKTPFHYAVKDGNIELTLALSELGANPEIKDKNGKTAFDYASEEIKAIIRTATLKKKKRIGFM